jgi:hypothetical protein
MRLPLRFAFGIEVPIPYNRAPTCAITGPGTASVGASVTYQSAATDRDGRLTELDWRITKEGVTSSRIVDSGESITFTPDSAGSYQIRLNIEDNGQAVASCGVALIVS